MRDTPFHAPPPPEGTARTARVLDRLCAFVATPTGLFCTALVLALLVWSRRPDVLLQAELWGDDGWSWYPDAYTIGWRCLLIPVNGYLNTVQRLVGLAVQPFPLHDVATLFAIAGLAAQIAPLVFLVSHRMDAAWPHRPSRLAFALIVAVLPDEVELYANLTNAQWNLGLLGFAVLVGDRPRGPGGRIFDGIVLLVSGLSGPFCLMAAPVALWRVLRHRDRDHGVRLALVALTCTAQLAALLSSPDYGALPTPLGAGPRMLARILTVHLLGVQLGYQTIQAITTWPVWQRNQLPVFVTAWAVVLWAVAFAKGTSLFRSFSVFSVLVLAAALLHPHAAANQPQWQALAQPLIGNRYGTMLSIAWVGVVFTLAGQDVPVLRGVGWALLAVLVTWAIPTDWPELPREHTGFAARARAFEHAPPGTRMSFPQPGSTPMVLIKR